MQSKTRQDRIIDVSSTSALVKEILPEWEDFGESGGELGVMSGSEEEMLVSGELGLSGNPVTIVIEDEVTGMVMELNHVRNALVLAEDRRKNSSGWLSLVTGSVDMISEVLKFVSKATVKELSRLVKSAQS